MIYIDVDTAVEVPVNACPLIDDTDFKSREAAVAYNAAGMDLVWNFVTPNGTITQTAVTPTTAGDYDWSHIGDGMYKIEIPASGGASINNDTEGVGYFSGVCTGVLPWRGPDICFRASGLNDALIESAYSATRGLAGTALPAAAADGAGGLIVSDAGGLDIDAALSGHTPQTGDSFAYLGTNLGLLGANATEAGGTGDQLTAVLSASTFNTKIPQTLNLTASGNIGIDWANVENAGTTVDLSATSINLCDTITTYTGNTPQTGDVFAQLPTNFSSLVISGAGAADALVQGFLNNTIAETTADNIAANFETFFDNADALTSQTVDDVGGGGGGGDATAANQTTIINAIAALNDLDSSAVQTACTASLVAIHLDHLLAADYDPASKPGVSTALLNELVESDSGVSRFTVNALENGPSGGGTAAAVWAYSTRTLTSTGDTIVVQSSRYANQELPPIKIGDDYVASGDGFADNRILFEALDISDLVSDFSAMTVEFGLKKTDSDTGLQVTSGGAITGTVNDADVRVPITGAQSTALGAGKFYFDLRLTANSKSITIASGTVVLKFTAAE